jgi:hypothetical protein
MSVELRDSEIIIHDQALIDLAYELAEITRLPIELALLQAVKIELGIETQDSTQTRQRGNHNHFSSSQTA